MSQSVDAFFKSCDEDLSSYLSRDEIADCYPKFQMDSKLRFNVEMFFSKIDDNGDGKIGKDEYHSHLEQAIENDHDEIDFISHDGTKSKMRKDDLFKLSAESLQNLQKDENGNMFKTESGKYSLKEVAKKDPQMGRFIAIAYWVLDSLISNDMFSPDCKIVNLKSLPTGGSPEANGNNPIPYDSPNVRSMPLVPHRRVAQSSITLISLFAVVDGLDCQGRRRGLFAKI